MSKFLPLCFLFLACASYAQERDSLLHSRKGSFYHYIYQVSAENALAYTEADSYEGLYNKRGKDLPIKQWTEAGKLIDSFPSNQQYEKALPVGYYLFVFAQENKLQTELHAVSPWEMNLLNNETDFQVAVQDSAGRLIKDAKVRINKHHVPFDARSQTYKLNKSNRDGWLKITHQGFTSYHKITKNRKNSRLRRIGNRILYFPPVRIVMMPFWIVRKGILDIVYSIRDGYARGFINGIQRLFSRENEYSNKRAKNIRSYIALSKPMYRPKDTLKLKAVILDKKGKPYQEPVQVFLSENYSDGKKIAVLQPTNELGAYCFELPLSDTLKLRLTTQYEQRQIILKTTAKNKNKEFVLASASFKYEDYELKSNTHTLKLWKEGKPITATNGYQAELPFFYEKEAVTLLAQSQDINGLNILDGRLKVYLTTASTEAQTDRSVFVPDTLWQKDVPLEALGETKIVVPDSLFPKASMKVVAKVIFLNSNNERHEQKIAFQYIASPKIEPLVTFSLRQDSLFIRPKRAQAGEELTLLTTLGRQEQPLQKQIRLPHAEKINPLASAYKVKKGKEETFFAQYEEEGANLMPYSKRDKDSLWIGVQNPRNLPFWYTLYYKNRIIARGHDTKLAYRKATKNNQNYAMAVQYVWQGKKVERNYNIGFDDYALKVEVTQPTTVYPGQKTNIEVSVKDAYDKPVPNADLTAYAFTKKFQEASTPNLPHYYKKKKVRKNYNRFEAYIQNRQNKYENLDWAYWKDKMGLDTLELYKLMYPENGRYEHYIKTQDSTAQFAVYATNKRGFQKVYWIDVDNLPVYSELAGHNQPYSLPISAGLHKVTFRTANREITLDYVYAHKGTKLIINVNTDIIEDTAKARKAHLRYWKRPAKYEQAEKNLLMRYLMPYNNPLNGLTYLEQGDNIKILSPQTDKFIYPVLQQMTKIHHFDTQNKATTFSFGYEPTYKYELPRTQDENIIKIRAWESKVLDAPFGSSNLPIPAFQEKVLTKTEIHAHWDEYLYNLKLENYMGEVSRQGELGKVMLVCRRDSLARHQFKYWLLESESKDFTLIYKPCSVMLGNLPKGKYTLFLVTKEGKYHTHTFEVRQTNGTTFVALPTSPAVLPADKTSERIIQKFKEELNRVRTTKPQTTSFQYKIAPPTYGNTVTGRITDAKGEPIPGVAVLVKGTAYGIATDIDGKFTLNVPLDGVLVCSFINFKTREVPIDGQNTLEIGLQEDNDMLNEVVVTGYSVSERYKMTGSVSVVNGNYIRQENIASFDQALAGNASGIRIRGTSSLLSGEPLYVVDGVPISASDFQKLNPDEMEVSILKDASATAIYGARGANGVVVVKTKKGGEMPKMTGEALLSENTLLPQGNNSLRRNFSDEAYWQPRLRTNQAGKASFAVTFPDDITNWRTTVLAHTAHKQTGIATGEIRAFKSLVGELAVPRFLVVGDTVQVLGKALNYTTDTLSVKTLFTLNGTAGKPADYPRLVHSGIDSLLVVASQTENDSLRLQYEIETTAGYRDGEVRDIPLYRQGVEEAKGQFWVLRKDTTIIIDISPEKGEVQLYAYAHHLDWVLQETTKLRGYQYLCNEQLASKIRGLLAERQVFTLLGKPFKYEKELQKHINELVKRQKNDGQWGWWQDTENLPWISLHALSTLLEAKKQGYQVTLKNVPLLINYLVAEVQKDRVAFAHISDALDMLDALAVNIDTKPVLAYWGDSIRQKQMNITEKFRYWKLLASTAPKTALDSILRYEQSTMLGGLYFGKPAQNLWDNHIQTTLLAYQILRTAGEQESRLERIRDFFVSERGELASRNTYEVARILEVILPDMLKDKRTLQKTAMRIEGLANQTINTFPFTATFKQAGKLTIRKTGDYPLYISVFEKIWNPKPTPKEGDFKIETRFSAKELIAGKPIELVADVTVKKNAEYTMIEIPIPAGCSYQNTASSWANNEIYREYFREKVCIYCQKLPVGKYQYSVSLLPRYTGKFALNPAKVEMMYFPTFYGRTAQSRVGIVKK